MRWRVVTIVAVVVLAVAGVGVVVGRGEPAADPARCADFWRRENATDCRVRLAVEAFARDPVAGEAAIGALPEPLQRDYAWFRVAESEASCLDYCKRIGEPALAESCRNRAFRPWLRAEGRCPGSEKTLADPVKPSVDEVAPEGRAEGDVAIADGTAGSVQKTIRASKGRIETCAQIALMQDPSTAGRVGVGFDLSKGHAENVVVTKNTTANDELGACIVKAVRTMRFDPELVAHVDEYAWVVSGR